MDNALIRILSCPDDAGELTVLCQGSAAHNIIQCESCKKVFPVYDGIPVLFAFPSRHLEKEKKLFDEICRVTGFENRAIVDETLDMLAARTERFDWHWEDEVFWSTEYGKMITDDTEKNWNDRIWQRQRLITALFRNTKERTFHILEVGCGEGQNFRYLLSPVIDRNSVYFATDVSLTALMLNRKRNRFANSFYVCTDAESYPFRKGFFDVVLIFGILHHTRAKEKILEYYRDRLERGSFLILHEAVEKNHSCVEKRYADVEESAHEERIVLSEFDRELSRLPFRTLTRMEENSALFYKIFSRLRWIFIRSKILFGLLTSADNLLISFFRKRDERFHPTSLLMLLERD